ncbi:hypothetical protein FRAAL2233 [Frankia alni ACN14a]|uniref:AlpA family phage regulatory protein n=2 Tax=Frankiaceae TaxID=74712 RepID=Q0RNK5_FRAAA|nr:hypothetical protein FRAAL2233 [Frankia alni ACN14a]
MSTETTPIPSVHSMPPPESDESVRRSALHDLVDIDELRTLLGRTSRRGERVARSYADSISNSKGFPDPLVEHPRLRLWLRADVEEWLDGHRPGWRDPSPRATG